MCIPYGWHAVKRTWSMLELSGTLGIPRTRDFPESLPEILPELPEI